MPVTTDCPRCNGTGLYQGTRRDGSTYEGPCFACQGGGPRYRRATWRGRAVAATYLVNPLAPAGHPDAGRLAPVWTPRQQAHLDAFAAAQPAAWVWLVNNAPTSDFAASLRNGIARYGNLTPRQLACVERNLAAPVAPVVRMIPVATAESVNRLPSDSAIGFVDPLPAADAAPVVASVPMQPAAVASVIVNLDRVRSAMESARTSGLRKVALTFGNVTMKYSGPSFRSGNGMILCYHNGAYCGFVDAGNVWRARYGATVDAAALDAFRAVGVDPQAAARTHGLDTGNCSCCRRLLTDPVSVMAGIGPVCIRRFGWSF